MGVEDPLSSLPKPFSVYNKNGLNLSLETVRASDLDEQTLAWAFNTVKNSMKPLYDEARENDPDSYYEAEYGWRECEKMNELREDMAWFLLVKTEEGSPVAFSHFRYNMHFDDEVLYCYDLQVERAYRRKGLGRFMMKVLEMLMIKSDMLKLMCKIFNMRSLADTTRSKSGRWRKKERKKKVSSQKPLSGAAPLLVVVRKEEFQTSIQNSSTSQH